MIGYLFLGIALIAGTVKGYCGKKSGGNLPHASDAMLINGVRMAFCILIGLALAVIPDGWQALRVDFPLLAIAALSGVGTAFFTVTWLLSVRRGAYMMVDVFLLIGVMLPMLLCLLLFDEPIRPVQWLGLLLLLVAGYVMCTYNRSVKGRLTPGALLLLILCALSNGITDFSQKLFVKTVTGGNLAAFNLYTYLFAALILGICFLILRKRERKTAPEEKHASPQQILSPIIGYITVMAVCLFLNSYFKTLAAGHLTATQLYPLSQGGSVILSMLMSAILFRERINARCIIGVALSFAALLMINLL